VLEAVYKIKLLTTNKHGASTHIQVSHTSSCIIVNMAYYHVSKTIIWMLYSAENIPPHNWNLKKQEKLKSSNCTRYGNQPLMMVGELIETCRVF